MMPIRLNIVVSGLIWKDRKMAKLIALQKENWLGKNVPLRSLKKTQH
jgi:hypothetical protein